MEVHSHGLDTLGVNKETDKVYNPELKDFSAPPSSQIPAGENFTVSPSVISSDVHVNGATIVGVNSHASPIVGFSFPPAVTEMDNTPDVNSQPFEPVGVAQSPQNDIDQVGEQNFQPFEPVGAGQNPQNDIHQVGEQDEAFDDMVILENDMVTSASLAGGPDDTLDPFIQADWSQQASNPQLFDAASLAAEAAVNEDNVGEAALHVSDVQATETSVTVISDVTVVSTVITAVNDVPVAADLPASVDNGLPAVPTSDGVEAKAPDATNAVEIVDIAADADALQKSEPVGGSHEVTEEQILAIKGQKVVKKFGRKNFEGEVVDFDPETKWFKVVYGDGDDEDLELWEVKEILASARKKRPRAEGDTDGSSQKTAKKSKKTGAESTAKKSRGVLKSAAKSPKTPGTKTKDSKSGKKSSSSSKARSPGKLIKRAINSLAFKTPLNSEVKEGKSKGKSGMLMPKGTKGGSLKKTSFKGGSSKKTKSEKVSRSLNLQSLTPKSQKRGKDKANADSSNSKVSKSSGIKRKAAKGESSLEKSKKSKKAADTEEGGDASLVGKQVKKDFGGTLYDGTVVKFDKKTQFYKVKYADGDQEDLELHELNDILVQDLANTGEKDNEPAKPGPLSSLSAGKISRTQKKK